MIKKIITTMIVLAMLAALIPISLADSGDITPDSGDITPYEGLIGADSPFYQVKIFAENVYITFSFSNTDKMKKQINFANKRVSEMLAAQKKNNPAAIGAAADEYSKLADKLEKTTQSEGIDQGAYADLEPIFVHHKECIGNITNETTGLNETVQIQVKNAYNKALNLKNGMPFYYFNGTGYFIPPGQANKIANGSKVPPGLVKKGYVKPIPTVVNGSNVWPWDQEPYPTSTKVKGNGNGNKR